LQRVDLRNERIVLRVGKWGVIAGRFGAETLQVLEQVGMRHELCSMRR
jgi:hypothetical protein